MKTIKLILMLLAVVPATVFAVSGEWLSKYATYEVLGESMQPPLESFLTGSGEFYHEGTESAYSVKIAPGKETGVVIDLGKPKMIKSLVIKNKADDDNQVGLKVALSIDKKDWVYDAHWVTKNRAYAWHVPLNQKTPFRYVKLSKDTTKPLELKWVKAVAGKKFKLTEKALSRLRYDGLPNAAEENRPLPGWKKDGFGQGVTKPLPAWLTDGTGLGLFSHWGLNGWVFKTKQPEDFEDVRINWPKQFTAEDYDPEKWMKAAKRGGFEFSVLTTRHHSGFMLWPSKTEGIGGWGVKQELGGRDLLAPWVEACRNNDIAIGFYFSPANLMWKSKSFPWRGFPRKGKMNLTSRNLVDWPQERIQPIITQWIEEDVFPCMEELLTRYGKIDYMWFDGFHLPGDLEEIYPEKAAAMMLKNNPDILINNRYKVWGVKPEIGDLDDAEGRLPKNRPLGRFEFCKPVRGGWFVGGKFRRSSQGGASALEVLSYLAKCRSWDGYFLGNVAPFNDGRMPEYFYGLCDELEKWMAKNKESLMGVSGGPWPERSNVPVTTKEKDGAWYLFAWPQDEKGELKIPDQKKCSMATYDYVPEDKVVIVKNVKQAPRKAAILATGKEIDFKLDGTTMTVVIPKERTTANLDVIKVVW